MELRCVAPREAKLLSILRQELSMSSTLVKRLKFQNAYRVNGVPARTDYPVKVGDTVTVLLDEPTPVYPAEDGDLHILYEDDSLIAVDKPAGMLVHPSSARNTGTLANRLTAYYQKTGQACAIHPVSRLDRDTFGVVLLAKNAHVHALMCAQSKAGKIEKTYHALVCGVPPAQEGILSAPIARKAPPSMLRCIRDDGKEARTRYRLLQTDGRLSRLELQPLTGRTHQLRVHCAHFGFPILGDPQYGSADSRALSERFGLSYQQLCAVTLAFCHPMTRKNVEIRSDLDVSLDFLTRADI
ncbi:MAG: RluA family pseudouridine synthase [Oscillospiraceae bacterium]|nr:RluA family pseudouridine synthase [Oscillospiraceae bacterium]